MSLVSIILLILLTEEIAMQRNEWKFEYTASKLAEAAQDKINWHKERLDWWKNKKEEVFASIRSEG